MLFSDIFYYVIQRTIFFLGEQIVFCLNIGLEGVQVLLLISLYISCNSL